MNTYWNGEECLAKKVTVVVGPSERPTWWCAKLQGQERKAVRIEYKGDEFYLDNMDVEVLYSVISRCQLRKKCHDPTRTQENC